jgi:hypothetical protein
VVAAALRAVFYFIRSATTGFTTNDFLSRNRLCLKEAFEALELCEGKLSCTVLRGLDGSNPVRLLGRNKWLAKKRRRWRPPLANTRKTNLRWIEDWIKFADRLIGVGIWYPLPRLGRSTRTCGMPSADEILFYEQDVDSEMRPEPIGPEKREHIKAHMPTGPLQAYRYFRLHRQVSPGAPRESEPRRSVPKV